MAEALCQGLQIEQAVKPNSKDRLPALGREDGRRDACKLELCQEEIGSSEKKTLGRLGWGGSSEAFGGPGQEGAGLPRQEGSSSEGRDC